MKTKTVTSSGSELIDQEDGTKLDESELRLAQLQQQLPTNEPGALMHLVEGAANEDDEDTETRECKSLFKNMKFFFSREMNCYNLLLESHCFLSFLLLEAQFLGKVVSTGQ